MPLSADLLQPIEGDNPAGEDLTYELILDELQEARREDLDVEQGDWERPLKRADHAQAIKLATDILANRSKDLTVAAWMAESMLWEEGFAGLAEGVEVMRGLIETFWEHVYPELEDDDTELRAGPFNWLGMKLDIPIKRQPLTQAGHDFFQYGESRLIPTEEEANADYEVGERRKEALADGKTAPEEFRRAFAATPKAWYKERMADLQACTAAIDRLDELGREKFGEYDAPSYVGLRRSLEEFRTVAQTLLDEKLVEDPDPIEPDPLPDVSADGGVSPMAGAASGGAGAGGGGGLSPEPTSESDAASRIGTAARFLRRADPTNPGPYLLLRGFRWGELRAGGGDLDPKLLDAPPTATRKHLKGLLLDGKWEDLLDAAEQVMATPHGRGWLDLQRYVLTACLNLGPDYDAVARGIRTELRALLQELPQLPELTLMDDAPTANRETLGWLQQEILDGEDGEPAPRAAPAAAAPTALSHVLDRAQARVRAGEPQKGIAILMRHADQELSERSRFLSRSEAAAIMVEHQLSAVALPILREMFEQITQHNLEEWESGSVVARPLGLLYHCLSSDEYELQQDLYQRICKLDPMLAMTFDGQGAAATTAEDGWGNSDDSGWNTGETSEDAGWGSEG